MGSGLQLSNFNHLKPISKLPDAMALLCEATNSYGIYFSWCQLDIDKYEYELEELLKAAPWMRQVNEDNFLWETETFFLLPKEQVKWLYDMTVGDDGPTAVNSYNGPCKVYALTCDNYGRFLNENT